MDGRHVEGLLVLYADGALTGGQGEMVEAHLASCPQCREELAAYRAGLRAVAELDAARPPVHLLPQVAERIRERAAARRRRRLAYGALAGAAVLAAVALAALPAARAQAAEALRAVAAVAGYMRSVVVAEGDGPAAVAGPPELAYVDADGAVWLVDAQGGNRRRLAEGCRGSLAWSPDGRHLACAGGAGPGFILDVEAGRTYPMNLDGSFRWSADGRYGLNQQPAPPGERPRYVVIRPDGAPVAEIGDAAWQPAWSLQGARLAYPVPGGAVRVLDVETGSWTDVPVAGVDRVIAWALGDRALVVATGQRQEPAWPVPRFETHLLDLAGGRLTRLPAFDSVPHLWLTPDGAKAADLCHGCPAAAGVAVVDLATQSAALVAGAEAPRYPSHGLPPQLAGFSPDGQWLYWVDVDAAGGVRDAWAAVYRARVDGTGLERLGTFPTAYLSFSPDLTHAAYLDESTGSPGGSRALRAAALGTGQAVQVAEAQHVSWAWRPAGGR